MTKNNELVGSMPLKETLKRTFSYVWNDKSKLLNVAIITVVLSLIMLALQYVNLCSTPAYNEKWHDGLMTVIFNLINISIIICYCRQILQKDKLSLKSKAFIKSVVFYVLTVFALSIVVMVPILMVAVLLGLLGVDLGVASVILIGVLLAVLIYTAPLLLVFPAIAVEDKTFLSIKKLFSLTSGSYNKMFWGLFLSTLPVGILMGIIAIVYMQIFGVDSLQDSVFIQICGIVAQLINSYIKGSYYSHIYQYFKFVDKKKKA